MEEIDHKFCYKLNFLSPHQDAKFKNFHYDKLNPEYKILYQKEFSNFEHCKTLYTRCDYLLEQSVHGDILKLEQLFKEYQKQFEQELKLQFNLINVIWIQSQRYLTITRSAICVKNYPEMFSLQAENRALCKFQSSLKKIRESNYLLSESMKNIQKRHFDLNHRCRQLDMSVESSFINGTEFLHSLSYITIILNDLFDYFNSNLCKMMCWAQLIDPGDSVSIEDYMNLIISNRESDVKENLSNCYCLRAKNKCLQTCANCFSFP